MDEYNNMNPNPNGSPEPQPQQPDYASQYNQQPQQPQQPDYASQYNQQPQQPDYASQYNQQPQQPDYASQYNQQPDYSAQYQQYNQTNPNYAQQPYQQNAYNAVPADGVLAGPAKVFSIISLVCGIVSMVSCCYGGFLTGIAAIVFSVLAKKRYTGKNTMATLGLVFGIVGLVIATISAIVICIVGVADGGKSVYRYY